MAKKDEQLNLRVRAVELAIELENKLSTSDDLIVLSTQIFDFLNVDIVKEKQDDRKALADATVEKYAETKKVSPAAKKPALVEKTMAAKSEMKEPEIDYDTKVRPATLTFASANGRAALQEIFTVFGITNKASELKPAQYADYLEALKNYGGEKEAVA